MAIVLTKSISQNEILNSYNNNIVEFSSNSVLDAINCTITFDTVEFKITPINNVFRFNFREVFKILTNSNNFTDGTAATKLLVEDVDLVQSFDVTYTITLSDLSVDELDVAYRVSRSVEQIDDFVIKDINTNHLLSLNNLKVFKGYPFDFSYFSDSSFTFENTTNNFSQTITVSNLSSYRFYFADNYNFFKQRVTSAGGNYEKNECWIEGINYDSLTTGYNNINLIGSSTTIPMTIELIESCDNGVYLKWVNKFGGWSYWLFSPIYKDFTSASVVDKFNVDFENLEDTNSTKLITGKKATSTRSIKAESLNTQEFAQLKDIITSPRVEMYNGAVDSFEDKWQTVQIRGRKFITSNTKRNLLDLKLTLEINQYTQV